MASGDDPSISIGPIVENPPMPRGAVTEREWEIRLDVARKESDNLHREIDRLSQYIIDYIPGEMKPNENVIDAAIRLLKVSDETKDDKIVNKCKRSGEPYIVFRAKDDLSLGMLQFYMMRAVDEHCPQAFVDALKIRLHEFEKWRADHPYRTRMPD